MSEDSYGIDDHNEQMQAEDHGDQDPKVETIKALDRQQQKLIDLLKQIPIDQDDKYAYTELQPGVVVRHNGQGGLSIVSSQEKIAGQFVTDYEGKQRYDSRIDYNYWPQASSEENPQLEDFRSQLGMDAPGMLTIAGLYTDEATTEAVRARIARKPKYANDYETFYLLNPQGEMIKVIGTQDQTQNLHNRQELQNIYHTIDRYFVSPTTSVDIELAGAALIALTRRLNQYNTSGGSASDNL